MRLHLTKVIEDRSPAVVAQALEKCLKREAWEVRRHDLQVIALGIGTSRNTVNLSDSAKFDIDSGEKITLVRGDVEYQNVWFLSEDFQQDAVHARFESVFANMRAALDLSPEPVIGQSDPLGEPASPSELPASTDTPAAIIESVPVLQSESTKEDTSQRTSPSELEISLAASPISSNSRNRPGYSLRGPGSLLVACILVILSIGFWRLHAGRNTPPLSPFVRRATQGSAPPHVKPMPLASTSMEKQNLPDGIDRTTAPSSVNQTPGRFLEQWAAAERTRDAMSQASFYADEVRPYLALREATRDAVYEDKQNSIRHRNGLWAFKIEDVIIRTESANTASVSLKKHFMMQTGSVQVSEQRIPSLLTLKHTQDGWRITGEQDLR